MPAWSPSARRRLGGADRRRPAGSVPGQRARPATTCASAPGRLVEEAQALCLLGGRRLVRVRDAGDLATVAVRDLLALPAQEGFVVLEAGDLPGSSSLRKLVEGARHGRGAALLPRRGARPRRPRPQPAGRASARPPSPTRSPILQTHLGGDRAVTRAEIAKLALYLADRPGARGDARRRRRRGRRQLGAGRRGRGQRGPARPAPRAGARARPAAGRGRGAGAADRCRGAGP